MTRIGGGDQEPEIRLRTESGSGTEEYVRRYRPEVVELLSTGVVRRDVHWTTASTSGHTDSSVVGVRDVEAVGRTWRCYDLRSRLNLHRRRTRRTAPDRVLGPELDRQEYRGTHNGISFEVTTHTTLLATP